MMKVRIKQISSKANECLIIECVEVTPDIESIRSYALTRGMTLTGSLDERIYQFNLSNVFYFEAVDERVFAYTKVRSFELKIRLYELENATLSPTETLAVSNSSEGSAVISSPDGAILVYWDFHPGDELPKYKRF